MTIDTSYATTIGAVVAFITAASSTLTIYKQSQKNKQEQKEKAMKISTEIDVNILNLGDLKNKIYEDLVALTQNMELLTKIIPKDEKDAKELKVQLEKINKDLIALNEMAYKVKQDQERLKGLKKEYKVVANKDYSLTV